MSEDFKYYQSDTEQYMRITQIDGIRVTVRLHHFEISAKPGCNTSEQQLVTMLRQWLRERQEKARLSGQADEEDN